MTKEGEIWLVFSDKGSENQSAKHLRPEIFTLPDNFRPASIFAGHHACAAISSEGIIATYGKNVDNRLFMDRRGSKLELLTFGQSHYMLLKGFLNMTYIV